MNYYFTGILVLMLTALAFCATPAYPRNEYLNDGNARCGEVDLSVSNRDYDYDNYDNSWNESNSQELRLTFRKYLGTDCKTSKENAQLKQQLELSNWSLTYPVPVIIEIILNKIDLRLNDSKSFIARYVDKIIIDINIIFKKLLI